MTSNAYQISSSLTGPPLGNSEHVLLGGALRAGIEYGFAPNWSLGFECDHLFMQSAAVNFAAPAGGTDHIRQEFDLVTARLDYKFGGPSLLKY
ncbi:outer membrane protein [Bradyrhizobium canariense]|uniref:outer membrane protein n=1 Tax=Bradyrhizobium canariense TaxID=255045 RepID=UPI001CA551FF|nr:hypothetical protein [Bradyrhizobium canariense]